jgi:AraC family transcriptional regulator
MAPVPDNRSSRLAYLTGSSCVINSSDSHSWDRVLVEHHRIPPGERVGTVANQHVLWLWRTFYSGEYAPRGGRFVPCLKGNGDLTVTPFGFQPTWLSFRSSEAIICALDSTSVGEVLSELDRQPRTEPIFRPKFEDRTLRRLMTLLSDELRAGAPSGKLYADSLAYALAVRYLRLEERSPQAPVHSRVSALPPHVLKRVLERIEDGFHSEISLASLAEEAGYSRGHFLKMFRTSMAMTPHRYVLQRRVEHAQSLLKRHDMTIIDVAADCGFSSQAHLTHVFRQQLGVTPGAYRRNQ